MIAREGRGLKNMWAILHSGALLLPAPIAHVTPCSTLLLPLRAVVRNCSLPWGVLADNSVCVCVFQLAYIVIGGFIMIGCFYCFYFCLAPAFINVILCEWMLFSAAFIAFYCFTASWHLLLSYCCCFIFCCLLFLDLIVAYCFYMEWKLS